MNLYYESSDGTIINFLEGPLNAQDPESLVAGKWSYSTISGVNGIGRVKRLWRSTEERKLKVNVLADNAAEFNAVMDLMHRTFDRDVRRMKPGKLWWNDYYKEVFAVESDHEEFDEQMESIEKTILFISVHPVWTKKTTFQYLPSTVATGGLDYPMDYGFDYDQAVLIETVNNESIGDANFEIIFYGPCINPSVTIEGHAYTLYVTLSAGEYATIDSKTKKITKHAIDGAEENIFYLRERESYIFEPIPEGNISVMRSKSVGLDISIFDERGEPRWI